MTSPPAAVGSCSDLASCFVDGSGSAAAVVSVVIVATVVVFAWRFLLASVATEQRRVAALGADAATAEAERIAAEAEAAEAAAAADAEARRLEAEAVEAAAKEAAAAEAALRKAALDAATTDGSLERIFQKKHDLGPVVQDLGNEVATIRAMLDALHGHVPDEGLFERVVILADREVTVRGATVDGIVRVSTAFANPGPAR